MNAHSGIKAGAKSPHHVDIHVGGRVKQRRLLCGYSQEQLAIFLGLTFQQVQKYEKGTNRISSSRLWEISQFLGTDIAYFYEELKKLASQKAPTDDPANLKLNKYFNRIKSDVLQGQAVQFVKSLSEVKAE